MNKDYWRNRFNISDTADIIFYQNPKFFRSNSFKSESLNKELDEIIKEVGKVNIYTITGIANNHHKHTGKRLKICLVKKYLT